MDQTPQLKDLPDIPHPGAINDGTADGTADGDAVADDAPPLGPFRTFQVPIRDIAALTGLDLAQLSAVDRMPIASTLPTARITTTWRELTSPEHLDLDFDLNN